MIYPFVLPLYRRTDSKLGHFILLKRLEDASESERAWSGICTHIKQIRIFALVMSAYIEIIKKNADGYECGSQRCNDFIEKYLPF